MRFIIYPSDRTLAVDQLGGKAATLADLVDQSFPIPEWRVVTPAAFTASLTPPQHQSWVDGAIPSVLENLTLAETVYQELTAALADWGGDRVAVRSSAVDEDGGQQSFAGQLESFLFVAPEEVPQRIIEVWKSGFSDRILAYRHEHQLPPLPQPPAVLIQRMVEAEVAGVAFSADPVTGQRHVVVISAVYGLGTSLVSGEADADLYHVDRQGRILQRHIASKEQAHRFDSNRSDHIAAVAVNTELVHQPALTDEQVQAIASLVCQVERHFGRPQDIEWAIANGKLYLLQARPITTLASLADPEGVLNLWDNSNIVESYGGITTPLTFSFARRAYEEVYRQFCRMMGVSESAIAQNDSTFRRMLGLIRGRIYYNLLNWYRVLALLPGFTVNRRFMEQMMGVREALPADLVAALSTANFNDKVRDSLHLLRTLIGLVRNYATLPSQIDRFDQRLNQALALPAAELATLRPDQLTAYYQSLERQLLTRWDAPLVNDFFAMIFYGVLRKLTANWCGDTDGTLQNDLISGEGGMISAEPAQRVRQLADLAATHPPFVAQLCHGSLLEIRRQMPTVPQFQDLYEAYLQKFGDRCLEELKLESATLHDDPLLLLRSVGQLAYYRPAAPVQPYCPRSAAEQRVRTTLHGHPLRQVLFYWVLQNARSRVRDRENLRFQRTRLFGRVRRIFLEIGKRLQALDLLAQSRDIFYLEVNEILGFIDGTTSTTDLKGLVALRQVEFAQYQTAPSPSDRFETRGIVYQGNAFAEGAIAQPIDSATLQGLGCCPGVVRAPVQVVTDAKNAVLRQGSILVAERTDPGWIMLFPSASGLLVERGSLLSHSAIVAREMGIPAIVAIPGITQWLQDGDWVEMDGSSGLIRRITMETPPPMPPMPFPQAQVAHGQ